MVSCYICIIHAYATDASSIISFRRELALLILTANTIPPLCTMAVLDHAMSKHEEDSI